MESNKTRRLTTYCSVPLCGNYARKGLSFHKFPANKQIRQRWETVLKLGRPASKFMLVCSEHFKDYDYFPVFGTPKLRRIKRDVIPSKKLPNEKQLVSDDDEQLVQTKEEPKPEQNWSTTTVPVCFDPAVIKESTTLDPRTFTEMEAMVSNGMCRCCASEGTFKDVKSTYHWMGEEEIYSDMLQECFDISLIPAEDRDEGGGICEVCITQLRNASNFKKQVLHTEDQFKLRLRGDVFKNDIVKIEPTKMDDDGSDSDNNMSDDYPLADSAGIREYDVPIKIEAEEKPKKRAAAAKAKATTSRAKKAKTEGGATTSKHGHDLRCQICSTEFGTRYNLRRHLRVVHGSDAITTGKMLCEGCGKVCFNDDYLIKHLAVGCPSKSKTCVKCDVVFERTSDMYKHMKMMHWTESRLLKFKCSFCGGVSKSHEEHDAHLERTHEVSLNFGDLTFDSMEDLNQWKEDTESDENVCFLKRNSSTGRAYYHCYPIKFIGSRRVRGRGGICPARIEVVKEKDGIRVTYQSTHTCDDGSGRRKEKAQVFCPVCELQLDSYDELNVHLMKAHDVVVKVENLSLSSFDGTAGGAPKRRKKKKGDDSATPERVDHRVNLTSILQYSTASPFRDKTMRGFSCLYCAKAFQNIDDLRTHTAQQSEKDKINTMIDYKLSYNPIKVDITNLHCTICDAAMKDLNDLKDHLIGSHNKVIHKDIKDIILPFRLENGQNFTCVICSVVHISFKNLYHHMSSHYRNYCCKKCGAGYITIAALRKHGKTHYQGHFPCGYCEKSYTSLTKKRNHEKGVHTGGWLRNKCPHCPEIFVSYYDRSEHLVKVHNEVPVIYPCNACNKIYKKKFELNRHIKHHHLQQRSYLCDKCNAKFFSKRGLSDHLSRHFGGEVCSCEVCGKSFSRLRTLKDHMKIHDDDRRFQCEVCKKTFVQKCSLKSHVKLHQDDLDIFKEFEDVKHLIDNRDLTLKQIAAENKTKQQAEKMKRQFT